MSYLQSHYCRVLLEGEQTGLHWECSASPETFWLSLPSICYHSMISFIKPAFIATPTGSYADTAAASFGIACVFAYFCAILQSFQVHTSVITRKPIQTGKKGAKEAIRPTWAKKQRLCKFLGLHWVRLDCQLPKPTKISEKRNYTVKHPLGFWVYSPFEGQVNFIPIYCQEFMALLGLHLRWSDAQWHHRASLQPQYKNAFKQKTQVSAMQAKLESF